MKNILGLSLLLSAGLMFAACSSDSDNTPTGGDAGAAGESTGAAGSGAEAGSTGAAAGAPEGGAPEGGSPDMGGAAGSEAGAGGTKK